ncbi:hypothetical protein RvY_03811 [Ramazzottius varieornatus]|uniref:Uncharacterized protein n=1 Tax=Ramazzottius varieornatus TaxID=947166 RepID=A0A1D1UPE4_RAMVA|nr:hypothetical protein RvY_03811 [Ramazzottius varieornatus]
MEKNRGKAKGLRNRKRNIEAVEESATDSEDESPTKQGYPHQSDRERRLSRTPSEGQSKTRQGTSSDRYSSHKETFRVCFNIKSQDDFPAITQT